MGYHIKLYNFPQEIDIFFLPDVVTILNVINVPSNSHEVSDSWLSAHMAQTTIVTCGRIRVKTLAVFPGDSDELSRSYKLKDVCMVNWLHVSVADLGGPWPPWPWFCATCQP